MRQKLDIILSKWISRKLMVFVITTIGLFLGKIQSTDFVILATAYVGMVGFTEIVMKLKK